MAPERRAIRILMANLPALLRDIAEEILLRRPGVELLGHVYCEDVNAAVRRFAADAVALELPRGAMPELCRSLLAEFPGVVVVGVSDDALRTAVYLHNVGTSELFETIRVVVEQLRDAVARKGALA